MYKRQSRRSWTSWRACTGPARSSPSSRRAPWPRAAASSKPASGASTPFRLSLIRIKKFIGEYAAEMGGVDTVSSTHLGNVRRCGCYLSSARNRWSSRSSESPADEMCIRDSIRFERIRQITALPMRKVPDIRDLSLFHLREDVDFVHLAVVARIEAPRHAQHDPRPAVGQHQQLSLIHI